MVWNGATGNKLSAVTLKSSWVMACGYGKDHVAAGGLDNLVSVYSLDPDGKTNLNAPPKCELNAHEGYVSCIRFLGDGGSNKLVSASGDQRCILWDYNQAKLVRAYEDHTSDVMSVSCNPSNMSLIVTGACDEKARVFDLRQDGKKCARVSFASIVYFCCWCLIFIYIYILAIFLISITLLLLFYVLNSISFLQHWLYLFIRFL